MSCTVCKTNVSTTSKHCSRCNRCVEDFDHHCKWLNNCIGKSNYHWFLALLGSMWGGYATQILFGGIAAARLYQREVGDVDEFVREGRITVWVILIVHLAFSGIILLCISHLIALHIWLRANHLTTFEWIKSRREKAHMLKVQSEKSDSHIHAEDTTINFRGESVLKQFTDSQCEMVVPGIPRTAGESGELAEKVTLKTAHN